MASLKRNLLYNFLLSCTQVLVPLFSIPYISRVLDPDGIGRVGFIDSFTYYFVVIAELGIMSYGIREVARAKNDPPRLRQLLSELITLHVISSGIALLAYLTGIFILWGKIGDWRLVLFSLSYFLVNFFMCEWYFIGREKFGFIALRSMIIRVGGLLGIFLLIQEPADYIWYYAIITGSSIATLSWNFLVLTREAGFSIRTANWKKHLQFVWVTYLISLLYSIPLMLDNVILGLVSTAAFVGLYSFSVKVVRIGANLLTDSFLVFMPRVVSLAEEDAAIQLGEKLRLNIQFIILAAVPLGMGIFLLAGDIAVIFFGEKFAGAADNLRLLAVYPLLKGAGLFLSNPILIARDRERLFLKNLFISSVFFVIAALIAGHHHHATGMCAAVVAAELLLWALNYVTVRRVFPDVRAFDWSMFIQALFASLLFIPLVYLINAQVNAGWARLIASISCCIFVYVLVQYFILRNSFVRHVFNSLKR